MQSNDFTILMNGIVLMADVFPGVTYHSLNAVANYFMPFVLNEELTQSKFLFDGEI